jgi:hypothetical protein
LKICILITKGDEFFTTEDTSTKTNRLVSTYIPLLLVKIQSTVNFNLMLKISVFAGPSSGEALVCGLFTLLVNLALLNSKKKSKAVPLHAMEAHGGRGGIAPTRS